jgi:Ca-activated chloride channel family protein
MKAKLSIIIFLLIMPTSAYADGFLDWWLTPDQQGRFQFQRGNFQKSARAFEQTNWKAIAFYEAGDFANAAVLFEKDKSPEGLFRLGNSLAKQEKLEPAIDAYKEALLLIPDFKEAIFNLEWVEGLLKLSKKEYDDAGGTGGKLGADRIVIDERGKKGKSETSTQQLQAQTGLSDEQIRKMWMRRVQTTPGDFLAFKFYYQLSARDAATKVDQQ